MRGLLNNTFLQFKYEHIGVNFFVKQVFISVFCSCNDSKKSNFSIKNKGVTKPCTIYEGHFFLNNAVLTQWPGCVP